MLDDPLMQFLALLLIMGVLGSAAARPKEPDPCWVAIVVYGGFQVIMVTSAMLYGFLWALSIL